MTIAKLDGFAMDASFIYYLMDESYFYWPNNTTEGIIYRLRR